MEWGSERKLAWTGVRESCGKWNAQRAIFHHGRKDIDCGSDDE